MGKDFTISLCKAGRDLSKKKHSSLEGTSVGKGVLRVFKGIGVLSVLEVIRVFQVIGGIKGI